MTCNKTTLSILERVRRQPANGDCGHSSVGRVNSCKNGGEPPCLRHSRTPIRHSREGGNPSVELPVLEPTSIGPRSFNRGNLRQSHSLQPYRSASIGPRSFNRGNIGMGGIAVIVLLASIGPRSFNRGNPRTGALFSSGTRASIGPRSFNRGNCRCQTYESNCQECFNWAAVFQPRKLHLGRYCENQRSAASIGPRSFNRGNEAS